MKKKCSHCQQIKSLCEFSKNKHNKDGYQWWCKVCIKDYRKTPYIKRKSREYTEKYRKTEKGKECKASHALKNYNQSTPRQQGMRAVTTALRKGLIIKSLSCQICNAEKRLEGHHKSYKKETQLKVIWLCSLCHKGVHEMLRNRRAK